jgi:hypothetical protein
MCVDPNAYDCVREALLGHLRLAVKGYGGPLLDGGVTVADSGLQLRSPEAIDGIRFRFVVKSFGNRACPNDDDPETPDPAAAQSQLLAQAAFRSVGPLDPVDVIAYFLVERRSDDTDIPATRLRVIGFLSQGESFFGNVDLGTVRLGEPAMATLKWDPAEQVIVWRIVRTVTTPYTQEAMSDPFPITGPAIDPSKSLLVRTFAPNCSSARGFAAMEALIDTVWVNP